LPAHITIEAKLTDKQGRTLVAYNSKYSTIHKILPKEIVPFRIEFEETAWVKHEDDSPLKFDPNEFTAYGFTQLPTDFKILARAVVADRDMYRDASVQAIDLNNYPTIKAELYNFGTDEISVPQVLMTYYDADKNVSMVDHVFMRDGIRQQAKMSFQYRMPNFKQLQVIKVGTMNDFFVNGLPQSSFMRHFNNTERPELIALPNNTGYTRLLIHSYIGNPTIY
jgi:hypothetical protein